MVGELEGICLGICVNMDTLINLCTYTLYALVGGDK